MQLSRCSSLPQLQVSRSLIRKSYIFNSRSTRRSRHQLNGPPISYSWRPPLQAMSSTWQTLSSTKSKASTPTFPTKVCGIPLIGPLKNKLWPWLPNSNKTNLKASRLPRKNPPPNHHQKTKIRRKRRKGTHLHIRKVSLVTQNKGMVRHITTVLPTTNTAIGTPTKSRNAIHTRR